jgi:hypothetical protein
LKAYFNEFVKKYEKSLVDRGFSPNLTTSLLAEAAAQSIEKTTLTQKVRVLDMGCGVGWIGIWLKSRYPEIQVTCSDSYLPAVKAARTLADMAGVSVNLVHSNLYSELRGEEFDLIICDVSGISSKVASMSDWFVNADPPTDVSGTELLTSALLESYEHIHVNGIVLAPFISLCNCDELKRNLAPIYQCAELKSVDWPAPEWAYSEFAKLLLDELRRDGTISFQSKFGMLIFNTKIFKLVPLIRE